MRLQIPTTHGIAIHRVLVPMQTSPGGTATTTATPEPTSTVSPYPDPVNLLNNTYSVFGRITNVHFEDIITGDQTNVEHLGIDATGIANCTSQMATVKATDSVPGTSQATTRHFKFIQKGKNYWRRQLVNDSSHHQWRKVKASAVAPFGFSLDNPLACTPSSSGGSGSGSGSDVLKDPVNLGPVTYHGVKTWHVQVTEVSTDAQGNSSEAKLEFYISQDHFLPYGYRVTIDDPTQNITLTFEQVLTQFGKKNTIPTPKVGSTKP